MDEQRPYVLIGRYMAGEITAAEREELAAWRERSPENERVFLETASGWNQSYSPRDRFNQHAAEDFEKVLRSVTEDNRVYRKKLPLLLRPLVAAAVVLLSLAAVFYFSGPGAAPDRTVITLESGAEQKTLTLPDGSTVSLNRNSTVTYTKELFGKEERKINFTGEAYFEIAKNTEKPFVIRAGESVVTVVGTAFNLNSNTEKILVTEGQVRYQALRSAAIKEVSAGEEASVETNGKITVTRSRNRNALAWKTGILTFRDQEISDVANTLARFYGTELQADKNLSGRRLNLQLDNESLETALELLEATGVVKVSTRGGVYYLEERKQNH